MRVVIRLKSDDAAVNSNAIIKRMFWVKFGWNWLYVPEEECFWKSSIYFHSYSFYLNLNPLKLSVLVFHLCLCAKCDWNWHNGTGLEKLKFFPMYFPCFTIISPGKKDVDLTLNNLTVLEEKNIVKIFITRTTTTTKFAVDTKFLSKISLKLYSF